MSKKAITTQERTIVKAVENGLNSLPLVITNEDDAFKVSDMLLKVRKTITEIDERRKARTAPANETIKLINEDYKEYLKPLQNAEEILKGSITRYAEHRLIEDMAKLQNLREETGDSSLIIPLGLKNLPGPDGEIRFRKAFRIEISDATKVPKKYLTVDIKAIQKAVDEAEGDIEIKGITITPSASTAIYTN